MPYLSSTNRLHAFTEFQYQQRSLVHPSSSSRSSSDKTIEQAFIAWPSNQDMISCKTYPKINGGMPEVNQTSHVIAWDPLRSRGGKHQHSRYEAMVVVVSKCFHPLIFTQIYFPPLTVHQRDSIDDVSVIRPPHSPFLSCESYLTRNRRSSRSPRLL